MRKPGTIDPAIAVWTTVLAIFILAAPMAFAQEERSSGEPASDAKPAVDPFLSALKGAVEIGPKGIVFTVPVKFKKEVTFQKDVKCEKALEVSGDLAVDGNLKINSLEAVSLETEKLTVSGYKVEAFLENMNDTVAGISRQIDVWRKSYERPDGAAYDWYTVETFTGDVLNRLVTGLSPSQWK